MSVEVPYVCDADRVARAGVSCCLEHFPETEEKKKVGRPKREDGDLRMLDIRLTPDQPISNWSQFDHRDFSKLLACEEGGEGTDARLHYHLYIETRRSDTFLYKLFAQICGGKGNKYYSLRQAHEGTKGYCVKDEKIVHYLGFCEDEIHEIVNQSREYRKDLESSRKREGRSKEKYLSLILKEVAEGVFSHPDPTPRLVMGKILECYARDTKRFPPRTTLENAVMTLMWRHDQHRVIDYYSKNLMSI